MAATLMESALTETTGGAVVNVSSRVPSWAADAAENITDAWSAVINVTSGYRRDVTDTTGVTSHAKNLSDVVMTTLRLATTLQSSLPVSAADLWPPDELDAAGIGTGSGSGNVLTYDVDDEYSLHIEASRRLWELMQRDETVVLVVLLSIVTCVGIVAVVVSKVVLRRRHRYQLVPDSDGRLNNRRFSYIYRPLHGNAALDDEYENTFVGVSIPILQDNTRI